MMARAKNQQVLVFQLIEQLW